MAISLYGTLGKGLDGICREYLTKILFPSMTDDTTSCSVDDFAEGKQIFHCPPSIIPQLQTALEKGVKFFERLFVLIDRKCLIDEDGNVANKTILFDHLYKVLLDSDSLSQKLSIWRDLKMEDSSAEVAFRLSIKCTGKWRRKIDVAVSKMKNSYSESSCRFFRDCESLGPKIAAKTHWRIELRRPDLEISVRISDGNVFIGFPLTKEALSNREYISHMGLRGSVCDALVHLADVQDGHFLLDPMCGMGTILLEAAARSQNITAIGVDIDQGQLTLAAENCHHFQRVPEDGKNCQYNSSICIFPADCRHLPFPDHIFDRIISDIPFGKQHSNPQHLRTLYPAALREMIRVLKHGDSKMVLLTSTQSYPLLQEAIDQVTGQADKPMVKEALKIDISLGETNGVIVVLEPKILEA